MKKIITLGGSNSKNSINKALANYAGSQLNDVEIISLDLSEKNIPLYCIDIENDSGIPQVISDINMLFDTADGFVVSLAEHNGSYTAAFKNVYDWMSRVEKDVWRNKPMLLMATSPGGRGGQTVLETAAKGFPYLGGNITTTYTLPFFGKNFSKDGIVDEDKAKELAEKLELFQGAI